MTQLKNWKDESKEILTGYGAQLEKLSLMFDDLPIKLEPSFDVGRIVDKIKEVGRTILEVDWVLRQVKQYNPKKEPTDDCTPERADRPLDPL